MKILCKCLAGSHMYGLNSPDSDLDYRGIFLNDTAEQIIGMGRHDYVDLRNDTQDEFMWEFRHYMNSLRKTNTQSLELLFNDKWIEVDKKFLLLQEVKEEFIDCEKLYTSLKGYMSNEYRLATGERTGDMGSKRRNQLEKYGFSPKNFTNLFRLAYSGITLFKEGYFPTDIKTDNPELAEELLILKINPTLWTIYELKHLYEVNMQNLDEAFNNRGYDYKFNVELANELILHAYLPILNGISRKLSKKYALESKE